MAVDRPSPVAIVGIACRLPGGVDDPERFWQLLENGTNTSGTVPPGRWPAGRAADDARRLGGNFLSDLDAFDAHFFGLEVDAEAIDPQHRLVLETAWDAVDSAGSALIVGTSRRVGMFVGMSHGSYRGGDELGMSSSMAAGRMCHLFDFHGPVVTIDTACSSSLVAVHHALRSLQSDECDITLVGGVNALSTPSAFAALEQLGVLSPDGKAKAFSAAASGFARSEGCVFVVLKRLDDAVRDGDRIRAVIRGSAINHDGHSSSLTAPNPAAQESLITAALRAAGVDPDQIQYVEAHGTGTLLGDPIEVDALASVFGQRSGPPLAIGSVKSNLGHVEAGAGIVGMVKVVLALEAGRLPPSLHFDAPNPYIPWLTIPIRVQSELGPWPCPGVPRIAGVSSFGLSGTNAHVVLEQAPSPDAARWGEADRLAAIELPRILPITARTEPALRASAARHAEWLDRTSDAARDIAYSASCRRSPLEVRLAVVGATRAEWARSLRVYAAGDEAAGVVTDVARAEGSPVAFVFPGQGAQWLGMGVELLDTEPVFRDALERCDAVIRRHGGWSVLEQLRATPEGSRLDDVAVVQPLLFSMQVGLAALWQSRGVCPGAVIGHSMGEVAAAQVAGLLDLDTAARVICVRSLLARRVRGHGAMATVELTADQAEVELRAYDGLISVAANNGPGTTVVSGDAKAVAALIASLTAREIFARPIQVDYASHSSQVDPLRDPLLEQLRDVTPTAGTGDPLFLSTAVLGPTPPALDAEYWWRNLRDPVRLVDRIRELFDDGYRLFLEVSPHPTLVTSLSETVGDAAAVIPSTRRRAPERAAVQESLGRLFCAGFAVDWSLQYPVPGRAVGLPGYAWQRERYWVAGIAEREPEPAAAVAPGAAAAPGGASSLADVSTLRDALQTLVSATGSRRAEILTALAEWLRRAVAKLTRARADDVSPTAALATLGMDSLMQINLKRRLADDLGLKIPVLATIAEMVARAGASASGGSEPDDAATMAPRGIERLLVSRTSTSSCPATYNQACFWTLSQQDPGDPSQSVTFHFLIEGRLDREAMAAAFAGFAARHGVFRTRYRMVDGSLRQFVIAQDAAAPTTLELHDVSGLAADARAAPLAAILDELECAPMDVSAGVGLRGCLIALAPDRHQFSLRAHHIACDGGALVPMFDEISQIYRSLVSGNRPPDDLPLQYIDYATSLAAWGATPAGRADSQYWQDRLRDATALRLPGDMPRESVDAAREQILGGFAAFDMYNERRDLSPPLHDAITQMAAAQNTTPRLVILAAFAELLSELSGQRDLCIESLHNHRIHRDLARVHGMMAVPLILRFDTAAANGFEELVRQTHQLVEEAEARTCTTTWPPHFLRRVNFNYVPMEFTPLELDLGDGTACQRIDAPRRHSRWRRHWDLQFSALRGAQRTNINMVINESLFRRETCRALLDHYVALLTRLVGA